MKIESLRGQITTGIITALLVGGSPWWVEALFKGKSPTPTPVAHQIVATLETREAGRGYTLYEIPKGRRLQIQRVSVYFDPNLACPSFVEVRTTISGKGSAHPFDVPAKGNCSINQSVAFYADPGSTVYINVVKLGFNSSVWLKAGFEGVLESL
jgi:hypothetical protein